MAARASAEFRLETLPAPARSTAAPVAPQPEPAERARPVVALPPAFRGLGAAELRRLDELLELVGDRYNGHGWTWDDRTYVDVLDAETRREDLPSNGRGIGIERFEGRTISGAIGAALRAARGRP